MLRSLLHLEHMHVNWFVTGRAATYWHWLQFPRFQKTQSRVRKIKCQRKLMFMGGTEEKVGSQGEWKAKWWKKKNSVLASFQRIWKLCIANDRLPGCQWGWSFLTLSIYKHLEERCLKKSRMNLPLGMLISISCRGKPDD